MKCKDKVRYQEERAYVWLYTYLHVYVHTFCLNLFLSLSLGSIWPCLRPRAYWSNRWVLFLSLKGVTFFYFSLLRPHFFRDKVQAQGGKLKAERAIDILTHWLEKKFCWSERMITSFNHITMAFKKAATLTVDIPCHSSQSVWGLTSEGRKDIKVERTF